MTSQRWQQIDAILDAVLEAEPAARHTLVQQLCAGQVSLEREVLSLLAATENNSRFIEHPFTDVIQAFGDTLSSPLSEPTIGAYKVVREIGRGGMGIVYLAERNDGAYQQQVAIKIVWPHLLSPLSHDLIQRFRLERQILASLNHPNIARLLDGGTTTNGLPYVVIEYITGLPLQEYCAQQQLALRDRLRLFLKVCEAVQFAHQKLIVHRDLKPGNILVSDDGTVKLLDFGIAKLLQPEPGLAHSGTTQTLHMLTPEYASPEQIRGEPSTIVSDVYSLGLILYELLTNHRPYQVKNLSLPAMLQVICDDIPPKPSTIANHVTQQNGVVTVTPSAKLSAQLKGDLDTMILTALQKAPEQRYPSVWQFSEDIRRYLDGRPIHAHTASLRYRTNKFVRRNKKYVFAACLLVLTLLGGIVATMRQAQIANELAQSRRRVLYTAQMNLTAQAWNSNNLARVAELLNGHLPAAGEEDLRGFEWYYYWRLLHHNGELSSFKHAKGVLHAKFSPDGTHLATVGEDNFVRLWNSASGQHIRELAGHTDLVKHISYAPDGSKLVTSSADRTARIWDVTTGQELQVLKGHQAKVNQAFFSPDGKSVATAADDGHWKLWDAATGKELLSIQGHANLTRAISFSPDSQIIATGGNISTVKLWQARTGKEIPFPGNQEKWQGWALAFSPDGTKLAVAGLSSSVKVWEVHTGRILGTYTLDANSIEGIAFSPDGKYLAATSDKRIGMVWEVETGQSIALLKGHTNSISSINFSLDGKRLLTASLDNTARVWDLPQLISEHDPEQVKNGYGSIGFSPDFKRFLQARGNDIVICNTTDKQITHRFIGHQDFVSKIVFSPTGQQIASGSVDRTIKIWNLNSAAAQFTLTGHSGEISALSYSYDGQYLAAGSSDNRLSFWETATGRQLFMSPELPSFINKIAYSPNGQFLATGSFDCDVRLWEVGTGHMIKILRNHQKIISSIAFSPDAKLLATGGEDDIVNIWDVQSGTLLYTINELLGHITALTFAPNGKRLVIGSHEGFVSLWDPYSHQEMLTSKAHQSSVFHTAFTPDGKTLITADRAGVVRYWRTALPTEEADVPIKE